MSVLIILGQILLIDLSLAADNALVVGFLVAGLPPEQRRQAMVWGIVAAAVLRIALAFFAVQLLHITGLTLAGGLLLVWVAWKMARDYHHTHHKGIVHSHLTTAPKAAETDKRTTARVISQIVIADLSMSLDNVLGVAGVAHDYPDLLAVGLFLSVALMALASTQVARLAARYPKLMLVGTAVVLYTALSMIYDGGRTIAWW